MPELLEKARSRLEELRSRVKGRVREIRGKKILGGSSHHSSNPGRMKILERARKRIKEVRSRISRKAKEIRGAAGKGKTEKAGRGGF